MTTSFRKLGALSVASIDPSKSVFYSKVFDEQRFDAARIGLLQGDCIISSFETWWKLRRIGAVRCRGKRHIERDSPDPDALHYWVEAKGLIYQRTNGITQIVSIDEYYRVMEITDVERSIYFDNFENPSDKTREYVASINRILSLDERKRVEKLCPEILNDWDKHTQDIYDNILRVMKENQEEMDQEDIEAFVASNGGPHSRPRTHMDDVRDAMEADDKRMSALGYTKVESYVFKC